MRAESPTGRPLTVEIIGSSGIGKSTLIAAVAQLLVAHGHRVGVATPNAGIVVRGWRSHAWLYLRTTLAVFRHLRPRFRHRADWRRLPRRIASTPTALASDAAFAGCDLLLMDEVGACYALLVLASRATRRDFDVAPLLASRWFRGGAPQVVVFLHLDPSEIVARRVARATARRGGVADGERAAFTRAIEHDVRCMRQMWAQLGSLAGEGRVQRHAIDNAPPVAVVAVQVADALEEALAQASRVDENGPSIPSSRK
jgi:energy-coupling factor transporter ATP-binding protein EcfA2